MKGVRNETEAQIWVRFWEKVDKSPNGCWIWNSWKSSRGYGRFSLNNNAFQAHRWSFEHVRQRVPYGLELDHLCRVRACVNPDHLEIVTTKENLARGLSPTAINARKIMCPRGHEYISVKIGRVCRICDAALKRAKYISTATALGRLAEARAAGVVTE